MSERPPRVVRLYRSLRRISPNGWLFSRIICLRAPYFSSIRPRIVALDAGHCAVEIAQRRRVQNHLGTVHAIALCNMAELAGGMLSEASVPASMRWIPKGMDVEYLARARGRLRAEARPEGAAVIAERGYEWPVAVQVTDPHGTPVFRARIRMWVSPKRGA